MDDTVKCTLTYILTISKKNVVFSMNICAVKILIKYFNSYLSISYFSVLCFNCSKLIGILYFLKERNAHKVYTHFMKFNTYLLHFIYVLSMFIYISVLCGPKIGCKVDQIYANSKNLATRDVPNPSNLYLITFNFTDLAEIKREFLCSWQNLL